MDQADDELKETIKNIWPLQAKHMIDLLVPPTEQLNNGKMTVGKIYGGLLILESWKGTRFGQLETGQQVRTLIKRFFFYHSFDIIIILTIFLNFEYICIKTKIYIYFCLSQNTQFYTDFFLSF